MVLTKQEFVEWIHTKSKPLCLIEGGVLISIFVELLNWHDNEPRDINEKDVSEVEHLIATEVDRLLTSIENDICSNMVLRTRGKK